MEDAFASVPDEVVLRTMALVDYDGERTVRGRWALSAVCKRWRDLAEDEAEGLPRLWRTVRLGAMIGRPLRHHHYQHGLVPWLRRRSRAVQTLTIAAGNYAGGGENNAFGIDAAAGGALGDQPPPITQFTVPARPGRGGERRAGTHAGGGGGASLITPAARYDRARATHRAAAELLQDLWLPTPQGDSR